MKFSFKIMFSNWSHNIKNRIKIRKLGKKKEAKQCKKLLKAILNSVDSVFAVSQNIENFGFRADEERPLHIDRSVTMAVASKKYYNGSVELSMFENEPSYPDKRVILLLYYNSKKGALDVLEYGGTYTDKVSVLSKSADKSKSVVVKSAEEKQATPTRLSK